LVRVFLDANVLFSAAYSAKSGLQRLWKLPSVELITSPYALAEARRNLAHRSQKARLVALPAKDRPILLSAVAAKATHLLTGDVKHFGKYYRQTIAGVMILSPAEFVEETKATDPEQ
jgi:predicted nucleic acid-binding protein